MEPFRPTVLLPYKFYGRDMLGIYFFILASCEPLKSVKRNIAAHPENRSEKFIMNNDDVILAMGMNIIRAMLLICSALDFFGKDQFDKVYWIVLKNHFHADSSIISIVVHRLLWMLVDTPSWPITVV